MAMRLPKSVRKVRARQKSRAAKETESKSKRTQPNPTRNRNQTKPNSTEPNRTDPRKPRKKPINNCWWLEKTKNTKKKKPKGNGAAKVQTAPRTRTRIPNTICRPPDTKTTGIRIRRGGQKPRMCVQDRWKILETISPKFPKLFVGNLTMLTMIIL